MKTTLMKIVSTVAMSTAATTALAHSQSTLHSHPEYLVAALVAVGAILWRVSRSR